MFFNNKNKIDFCCCFFLVKAKGRRWHPNWSNTVPVLWCWMTNIVAKLMTQEGFDWSSRWLIIKLPSIFGCGFISPLNDSVPGCLRCMARHTAMAKHIFTLQSPLSMMMLPLFVTLEIISHDAKMNSLRVFIQLEQRVLVKADQF